MNGSSSLSPPPQYPNAFMSSQQPQRNHFSYQHLQHTPSLSINPSYVHSTPAHYQVQRPPQQHLQQNTISPYSLQATPSSSSQQLFNPVSSTSFYATPTNIPTPGPTPEQRKEKFLTGLRPLLQPSSFTGAGAVAKLASHILDHGCQDVEPQIRLEIFTKIRDNAGNHYFRAWVENEDAMTITREWLRLAYAGKGDSQLVETIMPLLHVSIASSRRY